VVQYQTDSQEILDVEARQSGDQSPVANAFLEQWQSRLKDIGPFNILVEGLSDKVYLELAAEKARERDGIDLLEGGQVRIIAGRGTKHMGPDFGMLQGLESQGVRFVAILDGDEPGSVAAEAMHRFGAQKNRHFFQLERPDYRDKSGKSWDVEIEDLLPWPLLEAYVTDYPEAVEERFQRGAIHKVVIQGKPVQREGQTYDYKMMLTEFVRQRATTGDLIQFESLLRKARTCLGMK